MRANAASAGTKNIIRQTPPDTNGRTDGFARGGGRTGSTESYVVSYETAIYGRKLRRKDGRKEAGREERRPPSSAEKDKSLYRARSIYTYSAGRTKRRDSRRAAADTRDSS